MAATIIHTFLYDPDFINTSSLIDPVLKTGGTCVLNAPGLSYFVNPQEIVDPRSTRNAAMNIALTKSPMLVVDQTEFSQFLTDIQSTWTSTEQENLFSIIDELLFNYSANATSSVVEEALSAWSQYVPNSYVFSNTTTAATAYLPAATAITVPNNVVFTFQIANGTQYEIMVWTSCSLFQSSYPLSTISVVVPPLPLTTLYTVSIVNGIANVFNTALASAQTSQSTLATYIQSGEYTGFIAQDVTFVDTNGNTAQVQFNVLYHGAVPGIIAIRTAIQNLLLNSGVGNEAGWQARVPSVFVTQLFYLLPLWDTAYSQVASVVYPNIVPISLAQKDACIILYDMEAAFVTANLDIVTAFYNNLSVLAIPDSENSSSRLSLANEHPTYQDVTTTNPNFNLMSATTQSFATLLNAALAVSAGNPNTNNNLTMYTASGDNRTYITFSAGDVEYYCITEQSYNALIAAAA